MASKGRKDDKDQSYLLSKHSPAAQTSPLKKHQPYVGLVHRLDQCVSGVMVLAKTVSAAQRLSTAFSAHAVQKEYVAVLCGSLWEPNWRKFEHMIVDEHGDSKRAALELQSVYQMPSPASLVVPAGRSRSSSDVLTAVKIKLLTGRKHQIRSQMSYLGFPIFADSLYGAPRLISSAKTKVPLINTGIALCSHLLAFPHLGKQTSNQPTDSFRVDLPEHWERWFGAYHLANIQRKVSAA
eukprot:scaffold642_cov166-Ochromonas_danica.AAC.7